MSRARRVPWKGVVVALAVLALFASWWLLPIEAWMTSFSSVLNELGPIGYLVFGAFYVVGTVVLFPGSVLTLAGGLAFGLWGFPVVIVAATVGASLAFLVARYLARGPIAERYGDDARFRAIDAAVGESGWKIVGLLRLSPVIPFNLQNYLYGLTDIRFTHYAAATFCGIMPGTLMYVYFGAAGKAALGDAGGGDPLLRWSLFGAGLLATVVATLVVTRKARAKLDEIGVEDELAAAER